MYTGPFLISLVSGAAAGTSTDLVFFPIDTLKTRLQARGGFVKNGGYHNIYKGVGSAIVASAPSASLFFITYDSLKFYLKPYFHNIFLSSGSNVNPELVDASVHMVSSISGEIAACIVRVPAELIKQTTQTSKISNSSWNTVKILLHKGSMPNSSIRSTFYRGWWSTIMREIPFTCIQFPLYEFLKQKWRISSTGQENGNLAPWKGAICGSIAGGIAAATTTPLDFIKTRIMLSDGSITPKMVLKTTLQNEGPLVFFSGVTARTLWISAGGAIFLGVYETVHHLLTIPHT
ncbi:hypothetical protein KAFR_0H03120 [Kazachstania africana CBS 2517]|uniref:Mitochondrial carrier protein PET8 n=1 Tax=Kazachstania africana (strain ATCC 22294 / BCRC 22015 / CBS 2517 / CECT 1963 / NBRC 1671 / NRRL Y-8276) TaxID=1071382 RepID=H2AZG6_KAZAF|nr:hypothetical protein KAFR_0H03120 [Kazachstania africana CBS 2517]CCF59722.1 hypothetical protein KAFR_0H03120 [Kazachstania africana CBS 2517]